MSTQETAQAVIAVAKNRLSFILAGIIIISGLIDVANMTVIGNSDSVLTDTLVAIVKIGMGIFIIFDPKRNLMRSVGFYALSLGIARIISSLPMLGSSSDFIFIVAIVMIVMGVNLGYSGYSYLQDVSRGRFGMTFGSAALALIMAATIVSSVALSDQLETETTDLIIYIVYLFQYVLILVIMDSDEFRFSSWEEKSVRKMDDMRVTYTLTPGMHIPREDAKVIKHMFDDRSSWSKVDDGGPVECEARLHMEEDKVTSVMIMQKWKDSDRIYFTICNNDDGTILQANRFYVTDAIADDTDDDRFMNVRLYADGAMLSNISVMSAEAEEVSA